MFRIIAALVLVCLCEARPQMMEAPGAAFGVLGVDNRILGGQTAPAGAWPWQLSLERASGSVWSHACGASLLDNNKALTAAHCVDGADPAIIRIVAGVHDLSDQTEAQIVYVDAYAQHEEFNSYPDATYAHDIATLDLHANLHLNDNVTTFVLPPDSVNDFAGQTCELTGWGRTSASNEFMDDLYEVSIQAITTEECKTQMSNISGIYIWDSHMCFYDSAAQAGSCNGDYGGPANCPDGSGGYYMTGIASWGITSGGNCMPDYPSVYTRVSSYLDWINEH